MDYRQKALEQYEKHLAVMQPDVQREGALAARLYDRNIRPHLPNDRNAAIVDLGCGFGFYLQFLKDQGYCNVTGVDICVGNERICREQDLPICRDDNVAFIKKQSEAFDSVSLFHVLEHFDKQSGLDFLEAIRNALRPGGKTLIIVPNMANPFTGSRSRFIDITHEIGYTEESLSQILHLAEFSKVEIFPVDHYCLPNPVVNTLGKAAGWLMLKTFRAFYLLNAVRSTRIYTKHILAVATK